MEFVEYTDELTSTIYRQKYTINTGKVYKR